MFQFTATGRFENHSERKVRNVPIRDKDRQNLATYDQLLDALYAAFDARRWKVLEKRFALYENDQVMTAAFQLSIPGMKKGTPVWLGVQTSLNGRQSMSLFAGTVVAGQAVVTGKVKVLNGRRLPAAYTADIELAVYLDGWLIAAQAVNDRVESMRRMRLSEGRYAALLLALFRNKVQKTKVSWKWGPVIDASYQLAEDQTVLGLLRAVADGATRAHPTRQMDMLLTARLRVLKEYRRLKGAVRNGA